MNQVPVITIPEGRYAELVKAEKKLNALEEGGVDNWEWYSESLAGLFDDDDDDDDLEHNDESPT